MIATIIYQENEIWVETPYNKEFIDWIKNEVIASCRRWNKEKGVWIVSYSYEDDLIAACFKLFNAVNRVGKRSGDKVALRRPKRSPMDSQTAYDVLHLQPSAPPELVNAAYRVMTKLYHPEMYDGSNSTDQINKINGAYEKIRKVEKL